MTTIEEYLRDRIAMSVLQGSLSYSGGDAPSVRNAEERDKLSEFCYEMADSMMKARGKNE